MATTPGIPALPVIGTPTMYYNLGSIVEQMTDLYIDDLKTRTAMPPPNGAQLELLQYIQQEVIAENAARPKNQQLKAPEVLPPASIARLANAMFHVRRIPCAGADSDQAYDVLGIYQGSGPDEGLYLTSDHIFHTVLGKFNMLYKPQDFTQFKICLAQVADRVEPCQDRDLVAVNNGVFDFKTKTLLPFDPKYVFLSKSRVDYVQNPVNPVIHNPDDNTDWDVESWMADLSDNPEIVELLWQILGAIIRPNVSWNRSAWFYSETGNNGKGTLCALMRNLAGPKTCASISLAAFSKEFMLEPLIHAGCIVVDENDVGTYIDKCADLKAVITGDVLQINRKYQKPLTFQFRGFMVQCVNEKPRMKDKSESLYRRLLLVPFEKCFTGQERKYIKDDYLARPEVLRYVLHKVLHMDYYELSNPKVCQDALNEYKTFNDPVRQFIEEIFPELVWDFVPLQFLFDLYKSWLARNCPGGQPLGKKTFNVRIRQTAGDIPGWRLSESKLEPGQKMSKPEPLILEYDLNDWKNKSYSSINPSQIATTTLKKKYTGVFIRVPTVAQPVPLDGHLDAPKTA